MPQAFQPERAEAFLLDMQQAADDCAGETPRRIGALLKDERARGVLKAIFGNSPFLSRMALRDPEFLCTLMQHGPDATMKTINEAVANWAAADLASPELARRLRLRRGQAALTIALSDISGLWDLGQVTRELSVFAEGVLRATIDALLRDAARRGEIELQHEAHPSLGCGYVILAMGKLGAGELNYSSDIDLIILFDPERCAYRGKLDLIDYQVRFTRKLISLLQDFTEDGYVFRVDLRLRPDPSATPVALSVEAAENYYESAGKGWERAAMIKARPVAGDTELGDSFLRRISPFVWRKNLDYAAVRDVFEMMGLIRAHHGHAAIEIPGHNIKIGAGGIREIEFFAQTHQLIAGGRDRALRDPTTLGVLSLLVDKGQLAADAGQKLCEAYIFLRTLEHRLQMIDDEQTQTLPQHPEGLRHVALFMGFSGADLFCETLRSHLEFAAAQFLKLTGPGEDRKTDAHQATDDSGPEISGDSQLLGMGFKDPARARGVIETWRTHRYRALRNQRAKELLEVLLPNIVAAMARTSDPDSALLRFDEFLAKMPVGVQLLSLFNAHSWLLELVALIMGTAPALAVILGHRPALLDAFLTPGFLVSFPDSDELAEDLDYALEPARDFQDVLDITRRWANERKFQTGVQLLQNVMDGGRAGRAFSDVADTLLRALLPRVETEFAEKYGYVPGGRMAVVAMGKLGGRELTFTSDLDLIFIYQGSEEPSDGQSPLSAAAYFARLCQRVINALTAPTGEGSLYEVDMRLRPSGGQGPIAVSVEAFQKYHGELAQTWEHMAWTRARVIAGPEGLVQEVNAIMRGFLCRVRDPAMLAHDVALMRARIAREFHSTNIWDFKYVHGGMMDADFIIEYLLLREAGAFPEILSGNTLLALQQLASHGLLDNITAHDLASAVRKLRDLQQIVRLCLGNRTDVRNAPEAFQNLMAQHQDVQNYSGLEQQIMESEARILQIYKQIILSAAGLDAEPLVP